MTLLCTFQIGFPITLQKAIKLSKEREIRNWQKGNSYHINEVPKTEISVMYNCPRLAEEYAKEFIGENVPNQDTLSFQRVYAKYIPLYRAYVVNCYYKTDDAYGELRSFAIQMKIQILPDKEGKLVYNVFDLKEL